MVWSGVIVIYRDRGGQLEAAAVTGTGRPERQPAADRGHGFRLTATVPVDHYDD